MYPVQVPAHGLYEVGGTTRRHPLGSIAYFETDHGLVKAMYCRNTGAASVAAGEIVGQGPGGAGYINTAVLARANTQEQMQALGVSPTEAKARVASMSDEEVAECDVGDSQGHADIGS